MHARPHGSVCYTLHAKQEKFENLKYIYITAGEVRHQKVQLHDARVLQVTGENLAVFGGNYRLFLKK